MLLRAVVESAVIQLSEQLVLCPLDADGSVKSLQLVPGHMHISSNAILYSSRAVGATWDRCLDLHSGFSTGCLTMYELCNLLNHRFPSINFKKKKEEVVAGGYLQSLLTLWSGKIKEVQATCLK